MFTLKWILNLQDLPRSENLETVPICIVWQYYLQDITVCIHMCDENFEINRFSRLSQALVHFVMDRTSLFTDHKISGRPILARYNHFRTIGEQVLDNSPRDFNSSSLK